MGREGKGGEKERKMGKRGVGKREGEKGVRQKKRARVRGKK